MRCPVVVHCRTLIMSLFVRALGTFLSAPVSDRLWSRMSPCVHILCGMCHCRASYWMRSKHFNSLIKHSIHLLWLYEIEQKINKWLTALGNKIEYNSVWPQENLMVGEVPYMNVLILAAGIPWHVIIDLWFIVIDTRQARGMCVHSNIPILVDRFDHCACLETC